MGWRSEGLYPLWVQEFKAEFHSIHGREPSKEETAEAYERLDLGQWSDWTESCRSFNCEAIVKQENQEHKNEENPSR